MQKDESFKRNSIYVRWARKVLESYLLNSFLIDPKNEFEILLKEKAGCFVTLHKKDGELRGCIGTFLPTKKNIALEIRSNAISAATNDPRFLPVTYEELKNLDISVDILSNPELIKDYNEELNYDLLDPKEFGIIVEDVSKWRRGLLLPNLEGVDTVDYQIRIAMNKAGIFSGDKIRVYRFSSKRFF